MTPTPSAGCAALERVIFGKTNTPAQAGDWQTYNADLRHEQQPLGHRTKHRRLVGRRRGGRRNRDDGPRARQRYRWLDPVPFGVVRRMRTQTDMGHRVAGRPPATCARHAVGYRSVRRRPAGARRRRPRNRARGARGCRRPRRPRLAAGASRRARVDARRSAAGVLARRSGVSGRHRGATLSSRPPPTWCVAPVHR